MACSTPCFPDLHSFQEFSQTHVHWVSKAIQQSHLLSSPSSRAFNLSSIRVFSNESVLRLGWPKYWNFSISPSKEYPWVLTGLIYLQSKRHSRVFSSTTAWMLISSVLSLLYGPTLTSIHDYWKNRRFDNWTFVSKKISLSFNTLYRFVIAIAPRSKHLLILWLQSMSTVIMEPKKIKSVTLSTFCYEVMGPDAMIFIF